MVSTRSLADSCAITFGCGFNPARFFRYRESGTPEDWSHTVVTPKGNTFITINNLKPNTLYEFQVSGKNALGDSGMSKIVTMKTAGMCPKGE